MHNVTKYDGMLAAKHCEELTETATKTANNRTLSYSEPENHFFISFLPQAHSNHILLPPETYPTMLEAEADCRATKYNTPRTSPSSLPATPRPETRIRTDYHR